MRPANPRREFFWRAHLNGSPWVLDEEDQNLILQTILGVCLHCGWTAYAAHVRTNHVHAVVSGEAKPERMVADFKGYASRAFRALPNQSVRQRFWTKHGSTRYLWNETGCKAAVEYVLNGQGQRMVCYPDASTS